MLTFLFALASSSLVDTVLTVLVSNGREKTEINTLSDAIDHGRSGKGTDLPAGKQLLNEIWETKEMKNLTNHEIFQKIKSKIESSRKNEMSGVLNITQDSSSVTCETDALGSISVHFGYNASYVCTQKSINQDTCLIDAHVRYFGSDLWDFKRNPEYTTLKNNIRETLPYFLVKLRGDFAPFSIFYSFEDEIAFSVDIDSI